MSLEKAELKIAIATDIGATIEDAYDAAKIETYRFEGGVQALIKAVKACEELATHVDKDLDEGLYGLDVAERIKRYTERAAGACRNLVRQAENGHVAASGKVLAYENAVKLVDKYRKTEQLKVAAAKVAQTNAEAPEDALRPIAAQQTVKQQRLAEAAAIIAAADETEVAEVSVPEVAEVSAPEPEKTTDTVEVPVDELQGPIIPKRRGRPPKNGVSRRHDA